MTATFDIHINLAGVGTGDSPCWVAPKFRRRYTFQFLKVLYGINKTQMASSIDQDWVKMIVDLVEGSEVDYGVVLGFDDIYDRDGNKRPDLTQMVVPPEWVIRVCRENKCLLPCPGIHPHRPDALEVLDQTIADGAVMLKWLPPAQGIDPSDEKLVPFYERCAAAGLPILMHTGGERTFASSNPEYGEVHRVELALKCGVKVVAAHTATPVLLGFERNSMPDVLRLLETYPNFYVENSGICNPGRFHNLGRIAAQPSIVERTVYGSDWPIPTNSFYYLPRLGFRKVRELEKISNLIDRDIGIKREFGFGQDTLTRPGEMLANLDQWL